MTKASPKKQDIETRHMDVDTQNFRIGDFDNVREAYAAMIEEEGDDLANLAEDIVDAGLSLGDLMYVCPNPENLKHFVVVDGNRRFTALKLMEKPVLSEGTPVHKRFVELSKRYLKKPIKKVSTVVFADKEAAMPWIRRRHQDLRGRGTSQWKGKATGRADAFGGSVRASAAALEFAKDHGHLPPALERVLDKRTTNLDRVLQMPYMKPALGVSIAKDGTVEFANGNQAAGLDLLMRMLRAMAAPKFNVNAIRTVDQRKDFIDTFHGHNVLATEDTGPGAGTTTKGGKTPKKAVKKAAKRGPLQADRMQLALKGKDCILPISDDRLGELYDEACKLDPGRTANSASLLTRVFLELSTDLFLQNKVPLPDFHKAKKKQSWADKGITLEEKITSALKALDPTGKASDLKQVRQFKDPQAIHSVIAMHDYMHGLKAKPNAVEIKRIWERWHPYFERLFDALQ